MEGIPGLLESRKEKWKMRHEKEEMGGPSKAFSEIHSDAESRAETEFLLQQIQLCEELRDAEEGGIKWLSNPTWDIELMISHKGQLYEVVQNPLWEERSLIALEVGKGGLPLSFSSGSLERNRSDIENFDPDRNRKNSDVITISGGHEIHEIIRNPLWENRPTVRNPIYYEDEIGVGEEFMPFEVAEDDFCQYLGNGEFYVSSKCWNSIIDDLKNRDVQEIEDLLDCDDGKYSNLFDEVGNLPEYAGLGLNDGHYDDNFRKEFSPEMFDPGLKGNSQNI